MDETGVAMAKLAGIKKGLEQALAETSRAGAKSTWAPDEVESYFKGAQTQLRTLRQLHPELFGDIPDVSARPNAAVINTGAPLNKYSRNQLSHLARTIDQVFEIRANCELTMPAASARAQVRRVFLSHGRSQDWRQIQSYIERDLQLHTMELAQEVNGGATIIEKLERGADQCDAAVIVMTGDDTDSDGQARARENVMHEIGYFHGLYGRSRVILLHEEGVSVPTNLAGIVYVRFPKGLISAVEGTLARELRAIYGTP